MRLCVRSIAEISQFGASQCQFDDKVILDPKQPEIRPELASL